MTAIFAHGNTFSSHATIARQRLVPLTLGGKARCSGDSIPCRKAIVNSLTLALASKEDHSWDANAAAANPMAPAIASS
jgi:hypothetical protein